MLYDFMCYFIILLYYIIMISSYLKYSRYTPEVLEYFFWNIFFGMFWNIFGKGYLIPPLGLYLEYFWP